MLKRLKSFFFEEDDQEINELVDNMQNNSTSESDKNIGIKIVNDSNDKKGNLQQLLDKESKASPAKNIEEMKKAEQVRTRIYDQMENKVLPVEQPEIQSKPYQNTVQQPVQKPVQKQVTNPYNSLDVKAEILEKMEKVHNDSASFTPTPIISPIHGIIAGDKEQLKRKNSSKEKNTVDTHKNLKFDDVRNKAFGKKESNDIKQVSENVIDVDGNLAFNFDDVNDSRMTYDVFHKDNVVSEINVLREKSKTFGDAIDSFKSYGIEYDMEKRENQDALDLLNMNENK